MAEGGEAASFCSEGRQHASDCQYFAEGGMAVPVDGGAPVPFSELTPADDAYGGVSGVLKTFGEGAAQGVAGPLAPLAETHLGVEPKDISNRAKTNPIAHHVGVAAGLLAPALLTGGASELTQAGALGAVGAEVAEQLGLQGAAKVATRMGVENALFTLGDELSKRITEDPNTVQAAAMHVGLSGILGAGVGAPLGKASELWLNKLGPKAEEFTRDFTTSLKDFSGATPEASSSIIQGPIKNFPPAPGTPLIQEATEAAEPLAATAGRKAAEFISKRAEKAATEAASIGVGAALGKMSGIPGAGWLGGMIGEKALKPLMQTVMPALIKPILKSAVPSAEGLQAAFAAINAVARGETLATKAAESLFMAGTSTLKDLLPEPERVDKLKAKVEELSDNPTAMFQVGGSLGHYLPEHGTALAATAQNALNYLANTLPKEYRPGTLDAPIPPPTSAVAAYMRTLGIAEQPLSVLAHASQGTLTPKDMQDLKALYPGLYPQLQTKVTTAMTNALAKGTPVPYKMRQGLSLFMGQPMDSTLTAQSIQAAQMTYVPVNRPQPPSSEVRKPRGTSALGKTAKTARTPAEARIEALQKP